MIIKKSNFMKRLFWIFNLVILSFTSSSQDTISTNIYQKYSNLGIGVSDPAYFLEIKSSVNSGLNRNFIKLHNTDNSSYTGLLFQTGDNEQLLSGFQEYGLNYNSGPHYDFSGFFNISSKIKGIMLHANSAEGIIKFFTGYDVVAGAGIERLRISSNGNIGIGTVNPSRTLDINGTIKLAPLMTEPENPMEGDMYMNGLNHQLVLFDGSDWKSLIDSGGSLWQEGGTGLYYGSGNIGIGTAEPEAKVQIADGDIYISDIERGIIMKSPNGKCWRGTLDDSGNLNFIQMYCPDEALKQSEFNATYNVAIFPVPANDEIYIEIRDDFLKELHYSIHEIDGKLSEKGEINSNKMRINIITFSNGTYVVDITDRFNNKIASQRIIKN